MSYENLSSMSKLIPDGHSLSGSKLGRMCLEDMGHWEFALGVYILHMAIGASAFLSSCEQLPLTMPTMMFCLTSRNGACHLWIETSETVSPQTNLSSSKIVLIRSLVTVPKKLTQTTQLFHSLLCTQRA